MSFVRTFVRQPVLVNLLALTLVVGGFMLYRGMVKEYYPEVDVPGIHVMAVYPGVPPGEIEKLLIRPMEEAIKGVDHVDHIFSTAFEGLATVWCELNPEVVDVSKVAVDIQTELAAIKDYPDDAEKPIVKRGRVMIPAITVTLTAPKLGRLQLRELAEALKERMELLKGADEVMTAGIPERQFEVEVIPQLLEAYGLTLPMIAGSLKGRGRNLPGGIIGTGRRELVVRTIGDLTSAESIENIVVRPLPAGRHITIKDIAKVKDGFADETTSARIDGHRGVIFTILKKRGQDTSTLSADVRRTVQTFVDRLPARVNIKIFGDKAEEIEAGMNTLYQNGLIGMLLVLAVLWLFVGLRNSLMASLGIPIALLGGVIAMSVMGVTINMLSLFALILCLGIIVDDAIIIIENIYRYIELGYPRSRAAVIGTKEVFWPVVATVVTTISAFLPMLLMTGVFGKFFAIIPKVVVAALAASLLEALIILPSHMADFGRLRQGGEARWMLGLKRFYSRTFSWVYRHRYLAVLTTFMLFIGLMGLTFKKKEIVLLADDDVWMFDARVEMPRGKPLAETERVLKKIEKLALTLSDKELVAVTTQAGWSRTRLWPQTGKHLGMVTVFLVPPWERERRAREIIAGLRKQTRNIAGPLAIEYAELKIQPPAGMPVAVRIKGDKMERVVELSARVQERLGSVKGATDIRTDYSLGKPELSIMVDEMSAGMHGLTVRDIMLWVNSAYAGLEITKARLGNNEIPVIMRLPARVREDLQNLKDLRIQTRKGTVALSVLARIENRRGPSEIKRRDHKRTITVSANVKPGFTSQGVTRKVQAALSNMIAANQDVGFEFGGEFEKTRESVESLFRSFIIALLVIYVILGAQFRSFIQPVVVVLAIPFSLIGVAVGFLLSSEPIGLIGLIGVVGLAGIVVNDSLVLVDFINRRRRAGIDRTKAIAESGVVRMRPVLLTSLTTVAGLLPIALGLGGTHEALKPMAIAICWGLSFSTVLTLYVVPCFYAITDDLMNFILRRKGRFGNEELDNLPDDEVPLLDRDTI